MTCNIITLCLFYNSLLYKLHMVEKSPSTGTLSFLALVFFARERT